VIPNFVDVSNLRPLEKDNAFARQQGLSGKFVVNYSGNVGPAQGLETLVRSAELLRDADDIHFVITGDGTLYATIRTMVANRGLTNVTLLPYQPFSLMSQVYSAADICVVPQVANARRLKVPLDQFPKIVAIDATCGKLDAFIKARPDNQPDAE